MKCRDCGDPVPTGRINLGYRTCLPCGDVQAKAVKWTTAPLNKSNYMLISNRAELAMLNPKRSGQ